MRLSHLTDKILLIDTKLLVSKERVATTAILHHLKEIDRRKLYADVKCSSLFHYCTRELGYSEASAHRRVIAARLIQDIPEIEKKIEDGTLSLTNISMVNQFFKDADIETKKEAMSEVEGMTKNECEKKLFEMTGKELPTKPINKRISKTHTKVSIVLSDETLEALEEVKKLLGKQISMDELIKYMTAIAKKDIERTKFKQTDKPRKAKRETVEKVLPTSSSGSATVVRDRMVPAHVKRDIYKRDKKCTNCGTTHNLNFDHRKAYAVGGKSTTGNIRLLCFHCNQRARYRMKL